MFVFTQERFHLLLCGESSPASIDILVIDEAQKVGDGGRGVLLQQVIDESVRRYVNVKIIFASPRTENPEYLLSEAPKAVSTAFVTTNSVTVTQNLLWASQCPHNTKLWNISYRDGAKSIVLGNIKLDNRPVTQTKRLAFVSFAMRSQSGGNIVYTGTAHEAEQVAELIYDQMPSDDGTENDPQIKNLIELIQKTIHRNYTLARTLKKGIAYHYGNMPLLVRTEIERLFSKNVLPFLICTSTLIEGVNLPCKIVFARGPEKGRGKEMSPQDFWNLAGRAGRWGKEFQGHIVCIDPAEEGVWEGGAPTSPVKTKITSTTERVVGATEDFIAYLDSNFMKLPNKDALRDYEHVFGYLSSVCLRTGSIETLHAVNLLSPNDRHRVNLAIQKHVEKLTIPRELIYRNPGILPIYMQDLRGFFSKCGNIEPYIPVLPESANAQHIYERIINTINVHLNANWGDPKRLKSLAILMVQWMRGYQLSRLINGREFYNEKHGRVEKLQTLIRRIMSDVEQYARFYIPKYLACYIDVMSLAIRDNGKDIPLPDLTPIGIYLEYGVSTATQLSLIGIGLSRASAIALSEIKADDNMGRDEIINWINTRDWETYDIPELIKLEIRHVIENMNK